MAVKLHRCRFEWWIQAKDRAVLEGREGARGHGHRLRARSRALSTEQARRDDRAHGAEALSGIELEDGMWYREESKDMEKTIRDGKPMERAKGAAPSTSG